MDSWRFFELNGISHNALMLIIHDTALWRKEDAPPKRRVKRHFQTPCFAVCNIYITINFFLFLVLQYQNLYQNDQLCLNFQIVYGFHGLSMLSEWRVKHFKGIAVSIRSHSVFWRQWRRVSGCRDMTSYELNCFAPICFMWNIDVWIKTTYL